MEGDAKRRKQSINLSRLWTGQTGAGRAKSVEVIKVMHQEGDIVVSLGHPLQMDAILSKSAIHVKIYGADLTPKGRTIST